MKMNNQANESISNKNIMPNFKQIEIKKIPVPTAQAKNETNFGKKK